MKVKIYTITVTKAWDIRNTGKFASLESWGGNSRDDEGWDDNGREYELPSGFTLGSDFADRPVVVDPENYVCELHAGDGHVIVSVYGGKNIKLIPIEEESA